VIVDSSAVVAVLLQQVAHEALVDRLAEGPVGIGSPTLAEAGIVLEARLGLIGWTLLARLVEEGEWVVIPFTEQHAAAAVDAYRRYGKGHHPAALDFGDCLTYAVARLADEPLLCVGDDFGKTDLHLVDVDPA
jgi:ribonuclease VapC